MNSFKKPAASGEFLEFPDWSGMDDSKDRITIEAALELCDQYPGWYPELWRQRASKQVDRCTVDFVL